MRLRDPRLRKRAGRSAALTFSLNSPWVFLNSRGYSSAGRALQSHCRGRRFDPDYLHQLPANQESVPIHIGKVVGSIPIISTNFPPTRRASRFTSGRSSVWSKATSRRREKSVANRDDPDCLHLLPANQESVPIHIGTIPIISTNFPPTIQIAFAGKVPVSSRQCLSAQRRLSMRGTSGEFLSPLFGKENSSLIRETLPFPNFLGSGTGLDERSLSPRSMDRLLEPFTSKPTKRAAEPTWQTAAMQRHERAEERELQGRCASTPLNSPSNGASRPCSSTSSSVQTKER